MKRRDQIFLAFPISILLFVAVAVGMLIYQFRSFKQAYVAEAQYNLSQSTHYVLDHLDEDIRAGNVQAVASRIAFFAGRPFRVTVIDTQGNVVAESDVSAEQLSNHADRPEVKGATPEGRFETRYSTTMHADYLYYGVRMENGWVVRASMPLATMGTVLTQARWACAMAILLGGGLVGILLLYLFLRVRPQFLSLQNSAVEIAQGNLETRIRIPSGGVLQELTKAVAIMARQLKSQIVELRQLESFRSDFVTNVSHEIKTPLTAILSTVETLNEMPLDDAGRTKCLNILSRQTRRLNNLVQDILALATIERRQVATGMSPLVPLRLDALVTEAVALCQDEADHAGIVLRVEPLPEATVLGDAQLLEQTLVNLIGNALRHSGSSTVELALTCDATSATIVVRDFGCGIAAEHLDRLFERFYRVHKDRSRERGGTGLGLAIVKHTAILHHGTVTVASSPGEGTSFTLVLPIVKS